MPELFLYGRSVNSVFSLVGENENDITASIGWVLARSSALLRSFLKKVFGSPQIYDETELSVALQEFRHGGGITDIEIRAPRFHVIIEAKRGWDIPSKQQLRQYAPRFKESKTENPIIVVMSECSAAYAREFLPLRVQGISVVHVSWGEMYFLSNVIHCGQVEKRLMRELQVYLATIVNMQKQESNWVQIVPLGTGEFVQGLTYIQIVEDRNLYFHPYATKGYPKETPNYFAFRYHGLLQSIRHVESAEIIRNFHPYFPKHPNCEEKCRYVLYKLGKPIPHPEVRSGRIWNAPGRAMLDLLLTKRTVSDAIAASRKRMQKIQKSGH